MAEIRVDKKKGVGAWVWVVLALVIIAAVVWYLATSGYINIPGITPGTTTTTQNEGAVEWQRLASGAVATWRV